MKTLTHSQHEDLKRNAKRWKKDLGITHSEALERLAKEAGFRDYHQLQQSVDDPRPYQGRVSSADEGYRKVPLGSGPIWFALDVKDAEMYDHATFPKRWGIKEDDGKRNAIIDSLLKAFPDVQNDLDHPAQQFYHDNRVFSLDLPKAKTLLDVASYVREVFFWDPIYVFQGEFVFQCHSGSLKMDFKEWIREFGKPENDEDGPVFFAQYRG